MRCEGVVMIRRDLKESMSGQDMRTSLETSQNSDTAIYDTAAISEQGAQNTYGNSFLNGQISGPEAPVDLLEAALALEAQVEAMPAVGEDGTIKGYHHNTPTPSEQGEGAYNCSVFTSAALDHAGYNVQSPVTIDGVSAPIDDFINVRAETAGPEHLAEGQQFTPVVPDVAAAKNPLGTLQDLIQEESPRIMGAPGAMVAAEQASGVENVNGLRPGDLMQTWEDSGSGHSTIVHRVTGLDPTTGERVLLDENAQPSCLNLEDVSVELLGAHYPQQNGSNVRKDGDGVRAGDSIYTKPGDDLSGHEAWFGARPEGNNWAGLSCSNENE
jgi:hypothetical protein